MTLQLSRRVERTDLEIVNDGDFAKVGKKHYRHVSGREITYDCNRWGWRAVDQLWSSLKVAVHNVRLAAQKD